MITADARNSRFAVEPQAQRYTVASRLRLDARDANQLNLTKHVCEFVKIRAVRVNPFLICFLAP